MGILDSLNLPTLAERNAKPCAVPKHEIPPRKVARAEKRQSKDDKAKAFRDAVWLRDKDRCRATGKKLKRAMRLGENTEADLKQLGDVDHSYPRSTHPEHIYEPKFGILLQAWLNNMRKVACSEAPEYRVFDYEAVDPSDDDRGKPQKFTWRDRKTGRITKQVIG